MQSLISPIFRVVQRTIPHSRKDLRVPSASSCSIFLIPTPPLALCSWDSPFFQPHLCQHKKTEVRELFGSVASSFSPSISPFETCIDVDVRATNTLAECAPPTRRPPEFVLHHLAAKMHGMPMPKTKTRRVGHSQVALHLLDLQYSWPTHAREVLVPSSVLVCVLGWIQSTNSLHVPRARLEKYEVNRTILL